MHWKNSNVFVMVCAEVCWSWEVMSFWSMKKRGFTETYH